MAFDIQTILVPVDFGETAAHALDSALDLAKALRAKVHVLHVYMIPVYGFPDGAFLTGPDIAVRIEEAAQKGLNELVARVADRGVTVEHSIRQGSAHEEIVAAAKDLPAQLVVMGTHGRGMIAHALLGSVTERVVRTSPVPVLTIRHQGKTA
ncbi:MAG: universal stress protein [Polyangiales bacterium]